MAVYGHKQTGYQSSKDWNQSGHIYCEQLSDKPSEEGQNLYEIRYPAQKNT